MKSKRPSVGRIVLYTLPADYWNFSNVGVDHRIRPAIVTYVYPASPTSNAINLRVITDPQDSFLIRQDHQVAVEEGIGTAGRWHWPIYEKN